MKRLRIFFIAIISLMAFEAEAWYGISPYAYCAGDPVNYVDPDGMEPTMEEAGQMSLYMYGVFSLESISGGWNLVYQLQEQQDGYIAALFSRSLESTTEYAYVFRGTIGELDEKDWVTNLVEQPLGISTQFSKSMDDAMILNCRFPNNELTFVGHSKAGGQAEAAAIATSRSALTLNSSGISEVTRAEAVLLNTVGKIMGEIPILSNPEVKNYVTLFDPLNIATGALQFIPFVPRKSGDTFVLSRLVGHGCANFVK